jgi:AcrR family transcriptional regulator
MPAAERRRLIIEAAIAEFSRHGLVGASTKRIAAEADISDPYLYRLFATKKALFLACADHVFDNVNSAFRRAADEAPPGQSGAAMWAAFGPTLEESDELYFSLQFIAAWAEPDVRQAAQRLFQDHHQLLRELSGESGESIWRRSADGLMLTVLTAIGLVATPSNQPFTLPIPDAD